MLPFDYIDINEIVYKGIEMLKSYGIDSDTAESLRYGKILCSEGGGLIQEGFKIIPNVHGTHREITDLERQIIESFGYIRFDFDTNSWELSTLNTLPGIQRSIPIYCILTNTKNSRELTIISTADEEQMNWDIESQRIHTATLVNTSAEANCDLSHHCSLISFFKKTVVLYSDKRHILRIV